MKKVYVAVVNSLNPLKKLSKIFLKNKKLCRDCFSIARVSDKAFVSKDFEIRIKAKFENSQGQDFQGYTFVRSR